MSIAWEVLQGNSSFDSLTQWPAVRIDTAITLVLDETFPARRRADGVEILSGQSDPICAETCAYLLETSASSLVRQAAISKHVSSALLKRRVELDPSYLVRAEAEQWATGDREVGFAEFLRWRHEPKKMPNPHAIQVPFDWDDDPAVLLSELKKQGVESCLQQLPFLLHHSGKNVRSWALQQMLEFGTAELCDQAAGLAIDPRHAGWGMIESLVNRLDAVGTTSNSPGVHRSERGNLLAGLAKVLEPRTHSDRAGSANSGSCGTRKHTTWDRASRPRSPSQKNCGVRALPFADRAICGGL